jgi:flagellar export protein FliJ
MKKFQFTLQSLHNVREMREENELMVLSRLNMEAEAASDQLARIEGELLSAVENYNRKFGAGRAINAMEMELNSKHITALERKKVAARDELAERQNACARQISQVARAAQEVQVTGRLRENQVKDHRLGVARHEQNALDEMVTIGFARKLGESR